MDRRHFMTSAGALALATTLPACATMAPSTSEDARLRAMLDRFFYDRLRDDPEAATAQGLDAGERANLRFLLDDYSAAGRTGDLARARAELRELGTVNRAALGENAALDHDVVEYGLQRTIGALSRFPYGSAGGRYAPYVISQLTGPYRGIPDFLDNQHPIENRTDAEAYIARLSAFPRALDQSSERQRQDAAMGVFAPDYVHDTTLRQLRSLRDQPAGRLGTHGREDRRRRRLPGARPADRTGQRPPPPRDARRRRMAPSGRRGLLSGRARGLDDHPPHRR